MLAFVCILVGGWLLIGALAELAAGAVLLCGLGVAVISVLWPRRERASRARVEIG